MQGSGRAGRAGIHIGCPDDQVLRLGGGDGYDLGAFPGNSGLEEVSVHGPAVERRRQPFGSALVNQQGDLAAATAGQDDRAVGSRGSSREPATCGLLLSNTA